MVLYEIRKNAYYDSVTLMLISKQVKELPGVEEVLVGMATELNLDLVENFGMGGTELSELTPNDFFIAARVQNEEVMQALVTAVDESLNSKKSEVEGDVRPRTLSTALELLPGANLLLISVAGQYAAEEARRALEEGLHVMIFSDNVSIEEEASLKKLAVEKDLLLMGPDCGTAMINGVCLAFANVVNRGDVGIVGASGTGTQEIMCLIDKKGGGLSQVIGTGGRDLKEEIGGLMMIQGLEALMEDPRTKVIVLVSKPPAKTVEEKVLRLISTSKKPVVVHFIGGDPEKIQASGAVAAINLEDAAEKAVALSQGLLIKPWSFDQKKWEETVLREKKRLKENQCYVRGFYTGGTLADEAIKILSEPLGNVSTNIPFDKALPLEDVHHLKGHVILDLGDDKFTAGRPHPMIDPQTRSDFFREGVDESVGLILLDVVLGYGSHEDPAGEVVKSLRRLKGDFPEVQFVVVASVTGTTRDPQDLLASEEALRNEGVLVFESNAEAVHFVKVFFAGREEFRG